MDGRRRAIGAWTAAWLGAAALGVADGTARAALYARRGRVWAAVPLAMGTLALLTRPRR